MGSGGSSRVSRAALAAVAVLLAAPVLAAPQWAGTTTPAAAATEPPCDGDAEVLCAGAGSVDMTWHVGSGQGQLGSAGHGATAGKFDPFHHATKMVPSDGMQSRQYAKALVLRGPDGTKAAVVKTDSWLQQDVLTRRVGELVSGADPLVTEFAVDGLDPSHVMVASTHNHSAPYYTSTAWGTWLFTDLLDARMFEFTARAVARAVAEADADLQPARVGASVSRLDTVQQNIIGRDVADDGTPAGFPRDHFDPDLAVVRVESSTTGEPIGAVVNLGMHPESIGTTDLISADFVGIVERDVERALGRSPGSASGAGGPVVVWTQGAVGDVEPDRSRANPPEARADYWRRDYQAMERMSELVTAAVVDTWHDVGDVTPEQPERFVPLADDAEVGVLDIRFAGPVAHPVPTVSNCRTEHPAAPIVGLPDCARTTEIPEIGDDLDAAASEHLHGAIGAAHDHGVPVPDNVGPTSYGAVQESLRIRLQTIAVGDVLLAACPCEPVSDMVLNFKSRADLDTGDLYLGHEYPCVEDAAGARCDFRDAAWRAPDWRPVDPGALARMRAHVRNDAAGWEDDLASLQSEAEPTDPAEIKGNFTHREIQVETCAGAGGEGGAGACPGYRLPLMVGQANDYVGYVVTYREFQRGDHYRKALTAFGPHTADFVNTRLVAMAAALQGGTPPEGAPHDPAVGAVDDTLNDVKARAVGDSGQLLTALTGVAAPDDGGTAGAPVGQHPDPPADGPVERFGAATFSWTGGSNWTDNPTVTVERQAADGSWTTVATQEGGEVVLTLGYEPVSAPAVASFVAGEKAYVWTATWEVFDRTAPGTYRFALDGHHRSGGEADPYEARSKPFDVGVWRGIEAHDVEVDVRAGTASVAVSGIEQTTPPEQLETDADAVIGPGEIHYPDTYESDLAFIRAAYRSEGPHRYCDRCSFRAWADTGLVESVTITVTRVNGKQERHQAVLDGDRWVASGLKLRPGDEVVVASGAVVDEHGNVNGEPSEALVVGPADVSPGGTPGGPRSVVGGSGAGGVASTGDGAGDRSGDAAGVGGLLAAASSPAGASLLALALLAAALAGFAGNVTKHRRDTR